jgi:branched-chain amino acid transport system substrate-binding protein
VNVLPRDREECIVADLTRRNLLKTGAAAAAGLIAGAPTIVTAQSKEPIPIGTLCPLSGAGGAYGPDMQKAIVTVADRINKSGGIYGRPLQLFHEDSQTNPEAAVRAARKLIDVNHAVALMSTFASAVTLAVKPLAVESKVFYFSVSGADAITEGNHGGYIARTQPNTKLQGQVYAKWVLSRKEFKRVAYMALQTPFAVPFGDNFMGTLKTGGITIADNLIYEDKKPSYRSEITRVLATNPDLIMIEGYTPDTVVIAKELYRAAYKGAILGPAFAVNAKFVEGASGEVAEGAWAIDPAPSFDAPAYKQFLAAIPQADKNPYAPQAWDHMTMVGLALAAGRGEVAGSVIKDNLRAISNPPGAIVTSYEDGARLLREGKKINYEGASGSCDFDAQGDILSRPFGVYQVRKGKIEQVTIINP